MWVERGVSWQWCASFQDTRAAVADPPSGKGGVIAVLWFTCMCVLVCASLQRLLAQTTGEVTATSPLPQRALRSGPPRRLSAVWLALLGTVPTFPGYSGWSQVSGWEHAAVGQGSDSPLLQPRGLWSLPFQPVLPREPSFVPNVPMPVPGLARLPFALLTMPEPGTPRRPGPRHCWSQDGFCSP